MNRRRTHASRENCWLILGAASLTYGFVLALLGHVDAAFIFVGAHGVQCSFRGIAGPDVPNTDDA